MTEFKGFRPTAWLKCAINAYHTSASSALSRFTPDVVFQKKKRQTAGHFAISGYQRHLYASSPRRVLTPLSLRAAANRSSEASLSSMHFHRDPRLNGATAWLFDALQRPAKR